MKLANQVAIIVGGAGSLGQVIASTFSGEGAQVVLVDRASSKLTKVAEALRDQGVQVSTIVADITDPTQVQAMVEQTVRSLGTIDVLVNSAGFIGPTAPLVEISLDDWQAVLAINLTGPFLCSKSVLKQMMEQRRGSIVSISGTVAKEGWPWEVAVCAAKWGLLGLTKTLASEGGPYNVRANAVCPGGIPSDLMENVFKERATLQGITTDEAKKSYLDRTPLRRFVFPEEVARAVLFLASSESSGTTGEALNVSGGYVMH